MIQPPPIAWNNLHINRYRRVGDDIPLLAWNGKNNVDFVRHEMAASGTLLASGTRRTTPKAETPQPGNGEAL